MRESAALRPRHKFFVAVAAALFGMVAGIGVVNVSPPSASAADLSQFRPGNIISDAAFFDANTMTEAQIQSFLNSKVSKCAAGYSCLKDHSQATTTRAADAMCNGYTGAGNESAARIIYKVAQSCGLNPQVILVMLQKEQGLVLDSSPSSWAWTASMGYACPDTAACDTRYYGFFNQVYMGVWQLKRYGNPPGTSNYFTWFPIGKAAPVRFSPNASCGSSNVVVENKATAALYYYTPYQPNAAALAAGYGASSDPCSAYGNRNFYNYFTDWFGSSVNQNPIGSLELVQSTPGAVRVVGWALDPNTSSAISIHVYVGSAGTAHAANLNRADVGAAHPAAGPGHGFDVKVPVSAAGAQEVCVYAMNSGPGANVLFGCRNIEAMAGSPVGAMNVDVRSGEVTVRGWALDPDTTAPIDVHIYANADGRSYSASKQTSDVPVKYGIYGTAHGVEETLTLPSGSHNICMYGINVGVGGNTLFGCQTVTVNNGTVAELGRPPIGALESVTARAGQVSVSGWALDLDTTASISVHIYVGPQGTAHPANLERPDIAAAYPLYGAKHGFTQNIDVTGHGVFDVCAYGINTGPGGHALFGCKTATVPAPEVTIPDQGRAPIGNFESATGGTSGVTVSGWTLDPDTASSIPVHIYVGSAGSAFTASKGRADIAAVYPVNGANHGFTETLPTPAGTYSVCAYGINTGAGGHTLLGCRTVVVPQPATVIKDRGMAPIGGLEAVSGGAGSITVSGWTLDPDTSDSIPVHIYVGPAGRAFVAKLARPDIAAAYPTNGGNHGYTETLPAAPGTYSVCAYGINTGAGGNAMLGCRNVTVT